MTFTQSPSSDSANRVVEIHKAANGIIALDLPGTPEYDVVALMDTNRKVMSVYHINKMTGEIVLKSVRNVSWDLLLDEFNGASPTPREIRSLTQSK